MKPIVAITMGDPAGIGPEVTVRALAHPQIYDRIIPLVVGDRATLEDAAQGCGLPLNFCTVEEGASLTCAGVPRLLEETCLRPSERVWGKVSASCGDAAYRYVDRAIKLALSGKASAVVTGPLNKEALHLAGYPYSGHTEILAARTNCSNYAMLLLSGHMRIIHVSTHVSLREACTCVNKMRVMQVIELAQQAMRELGILHPKIAVAALNPHASENGLFGNEEQKEIWPAVIAMRERGYDVEGPLPPDTVFVKLSAGLYHIVVAMYHDQGHIPLKLCGFQMNPHTCHFDTMHGVNVTVGLPIIRTSVDHGTAYDRAGTFSANEESMVEAIETAATLIEGRRKSLV